MQLDQELSGHEQSPLGSRRSDLLLLIGCRQDELGRAVRELQFVQCERSRWNTFSG